jgi:ribonuclease BN (tRNA processing enzyme)
MSEATSALQMTVLGSYGPILHDDRASSGFVFHVDGEPRLLLDAGGGTAVRLGEAGIDPSTIDIALFSHFHADHTAAFPAILKSSFFQGRGDRPLAVYGPTEGNGMPSATAWLDAQFGEDDGIYGYLHEFARTTPIDGTFDVTAHDLDATTSADDDVVTVLEEDTFSVEAIPVNHGSAPTLAYRVSHEDVSITVATDISSATDNIRQLAADTDVLIHGAVITADMASDEPPAQRHSYPEQVAANAQSAGVETLVLAHLSPPVTSVLDEVVETIQADFDGDIVVAEDLMTVQGDGIVQ